MASVIVQSAFRRLRKVKAWIAAIAAVRGRAVRSRYLTDSGHGDARASIDRTADIA